MTDPTNLRSISPGHYPPSAAEYERGWSEGIISVDASVLLSLYRYSSETRDELLALFGSFSDRLWLPNQAAIEFERNRMGVIRQQIAAYDRTRETFDKQVGAIRAEFSKLSRHPLLDPEGFARLTDEYAERIERLVEEARSRHPLGAASREELLNDPTRIALEELFDGRVGQPYRGERLDELTAEARRRVEADRPPGYLDKEKSEPERFGDFFFWMQSVDRALEQSTSLIVLTDDEKDDWWWHFHGLTLGPRPELVEEFASVSGGERLLMYTTPRFIQEANRRTEKPSVSGEAAVEVERVAAERAREYEIGLVDCPYCDAPVAFRIGSDRTHTATPRCRECGQWFHVFHTHDDKFGARRPGTGSRTRVACSSCGVEFDTLLPRAGETKSRACLRCGSLLTIDGEGAVTDSGPTRVLPVSVGESICPDCGSNLVFVYERDGEERTSCIGCAALVIRPTGDA